MNKESFKKGGGKLAIISFVFIVASLLVLTQAIPLPRLMTDEETGFSYIGWGDNVIVSATEASPTAGSSSVLEIFFVNHSTTPWYAYDTNTSSLFETWANASLDPDAAGTTYKAYSIDVLDGTMSTLTVKWGVATDMIVRYRGNVTNARNATIFNNASCRIKVNASGGGMTTLTSQVLNNINGGLGQTGNYSDHTYIWINAYYNIGTLNKGGTYTITNIKLEFNY
jgi:hypothetical protein